MTVRKQHIRNLGYFSHQSNCTVTTELTLIVHLNFILLMLERMSVFSVDEKVCTVCMFKIKVCVKDFFIMFSTGGSCLPQQAYFVQTFLSLIVSKGPINSQDRN